MTWLIGHVPQHCLLTWGSSCMLCMVSTVQNNVHDEARRTNMRLTLCLCSVRTLVKVRQCHHKVSCTARPKGQGVAAQRSIPLGLIRTHNTSSVILRVRVLLTVSWRACVPSCSTMDHSQNLTSLSALPLTKPLQSCNTLFQQL